MLCRSGRLLLLRPAQARIDIRPPLSVCPAQPSEDLDASGFPEKLKEVEAELAALSAKHVCAVEEARAAKVSYESDVAALLGEAAQEAEDLRCGAQFAARSLSQTARSSACRHLVGTAREGRFAAQRENSAKPHPEPLLPPLRRVRLSQQIEDQKRKAAAERAKTLRTMVRIPPVFVTTGRQCVITITRTPLTNNWTAAQAAHASRMKGALKRITASGMQPHARSVIADSIASAQARSSAPHCRVNASHMRCKSEPARMRLCLRVRYSGEAFLPSLCPRPVGSRTGGDGAGAHPRGASGGGERVGGAPHHGRRLHGAPGGWAVPVGLRLAWVAGGLCI